MSDYYEFKNKVVVCRKDHQCSWCGEMILTGEEAQNRRYIWEAQFVLSWEHPECYEAMTTLGWRDAQDGWMPGDYKRGSTEWA